jgi:hypothetical protein
MMSMTLSDMGLNLLQLIPLKRDQSRAQEMKMRMRKIALMKMG